MRYGDGVKDTDCRFFIRRWMARDQGRTLERGSSERDVTSIWICV